MSEMDLEVSTSDSSDEEFKDNNAIVKVEYEGDLKVEGPENVIRRLKEESRLYHLYMRTFFTIADISSDLSQAVLLFQLGYAYYPILMVLLDFLPGIISMSLILSYKNECQTLVALGLVAHPLLMPAISVASFLDSRKNAKDSNTEAYRMYVWDVAKYVIGNFQAPCQMILTCYLVMTDVLEPPWVHSTRKVDAQNHMVSYGPLLTLLSLTFSTISAFKGCGETVDILKLFNNNQTEVALAWLSHFIFMVMFRIISWTLIFICAGWWSILIILAILCHGIVILAWKQNYGELSVFSKKNLIHIEWPIPIFTMISPTLFLPESVRPSTVSTPFKLINQVLTLGGNAVLMLSLIICSVLMQQESYRLFSLIIVQERLDLFLKISMGLGAFSTLFTLVLIGTSHKDDFIFSWPALKLKVRLDNLKQRYGMRCFKQVAISIRMALLVIGLLCCILPVAFFHGPLKGSVTLLVAGYKGRSLSTHIDVLSYGKTCRAKGIPSLPEYRIEPMVQLISGYNMIVMCGGQIDRSIVTSTCLATEPRKKAWRKISPMPFRLHGAASASVNEKMYVLGGVDHTRTIKKTVLEYDPFRDSWLVLAEMANPLMGACAVSLKHGLVVTGGNTGSEFLSHATYLGRTDEDEIAWVRLPTLLSPRAFHGCTFVTLEDFGAGILVAGGQSDSSTVLGTVEFMLIDPWGLTPITSSWIRLPNLNFARHSYPSVGVVTRYEQDVVLVAGGLSGSLSSTDTIEELSSNPLTGRFEWNYRNVTLLKPRHSINTVIVPAYFIKPCE